MVREKSMRRAKRETRIDEDYDRHEREEDEHWRPQERDEYGCKKRRIKWW